MLNLITEPRLYLLGRPTVDAGELARFLADENLHWVSDALTPGDHLPEIAGRICYHSYGTGRAHNRAYLHNILAGGDMSVVEHAAWTLAITGVSRSLLAELTRHRHFSFSVRSQRYVSEDQCAFVVPPAILALGPSSLAWEFFKDTCLLCQDAYRRLVEGLLPEYAHLPAKAQRMAARQAARSVLPNAAETKLVVTANARAWRHFLDLRATAAAEPEIRRLAVAIWRVLVTEAPELFGDYAVHPAPDGSEVLQGQFGGA